MINLWTANGDCVVSQQSHRGSVAFLSDINYNRVSNLCGPLLLSLGTDNMIKLWDLKKFKSIFEQPVTQQSNCSNSGSLSKAVWVGQSFVTASSSGVLKLYD